MRADRLLSILLLLQARGRLTGRELSTALEVSGRTIHRDLEALSAAGVPVVALRGAHGGWELADGWRTQVPGLDDAEMRALLMAQPRVIGDRPLAAAAERALSKLIAAMPQSQRERAVSMRERLYVDPTGWRGTSEELTMLPVVQESVARDRQLRMTYHTLSHDSRMRVVSPLGLVAKAMTWYLVADGDGGVKTYRVSRIESAEVLDAPVIRPRGFDLAKYWSSSQQRYAEERRRVTVTLRVEPLTARTLRYYQQVSELPSAADAEGWVRVMLTFEAEAEANFVINGLGPRAEVLEPAWLGERVLADAAAVVGRMSADRHPAPGTQAPGTYAIQVPSPGAAGPPWPSG
jgi:predicted DNA-binding transcriptional regulator YafY